MPVVAGPRYLGYVCPYCGYSFNWPEGMTIEKPSTFVCRKCKRQLKEIKCAKCGRINDTDSVGRFCPDCGHEYSKNVLWCNNGHPNSYKHLYCTHCGKLLCRDESSWSHG